jgi:hypothetical protein
MSRWSHDTSGPRVALGAQESIRDFRLQTPGAPPWPGGKRLLKEVIKVINLVEIAAGP